MKPDSNYVAGLYSLAANGDVSAQLQLCEAFKDLIGSFAEKMKRAHNSNLSIEELKISGFVGVTQSLQKLNLSAECPTYSAWIEKNIKLEMRRAIFSGKGILPSELN